MSCSKERNVDVTRVARLITNVMNAVSASFIESIGFDERREQADTIHKAVVSIKDLYDAITEDNSYTISYS